MSFKEGLRTGEQQETHAWFIITQATVPKERPSRRLEEEGAFLLMPIGERVRDADRCVLYPGGAHVPLAQGAALGYTETVDGPLTVPEFN